MKDFEWNQNRYKRGAVAVKIYGIWMDINDLKNNIKDFGDDAELKQLCEHGLKCYKAGRDIQ